MGDTYCVDSFHINVAAGDSAIHLLVQTSGNKPDGNPVNPQQPFVKSALLIDGGDWNHGTPFNVQKVIQRLPNHYEFSSEATQFFPAGRAVFNCMILTHWDKDHYRGLVKILNYDVAKTLTLAKNAGIAITANDIQISFFKYNGLGRADPQTTFYCPNWESEGSNPKQNKNYLRGHTKDFDQTGGTDAFYLTLNLSSDSKTSTITTLPQIAKLDYSGLLGMEFFSKQKLSSTVVSDCNSPTILVQKHSFPVGAPGAYCVATGGTYLHQASGIVGVVNEHDSMTNASSISIMILWPPAHDGELSKMSHYFAGDAEYTTEEGVVDWSGSATTKQHVDNIKASHHGSATSFPTKMIYTWIPKNIIASAGAANGHPRWELLIYLFAYKLAALSQAQGTIPKPEFYPTCYPYWFARNETGNFILPNPKVSPAAWDHTSQYTQDFDNMWNQIVGNPYSNPRQDYVNHNFDTPDAKVQFIFAVCYLIWGYVSQTTGEYYPIGTHTKKAVYFGTTSKALSTRQKIMFVFLRSGYTDDQSLVRPIRDDDEDAIVASGSSTTTTLTDWQNFPLQQWAVNLGPAASEGSIVIPGLVEFDDPVSDPDEADPDEITQSTLTRRKLTRHRRAIQSNPKQSNVGRDFQALPTDGDFYCSSRTFVQGPNACALSGDLDAFVSRFHFGYLGVSAFPTVGTEAMVLANDEFNQWLTKNFGITQLGLTGDNTKISTMQCILPFASTNLSFATENVPWAFNLTGAALPVIPPTSPPGPVLYSDDMLILALGQLPNAVENIQLSDVCTFFGVPSPIFAGTSLQLPLKLADTTNPGYRNALWFMPGQQYQTLLRLALDVTVTDNLNNLIFSKVNLSVHDAQVILRKSGTFDNVGGKPALQSTSEIIFTTDILIAGEDPHSAAAFTATLIYNFGDGSAQIIVQCNADRNQWSRYLTWVESGLKIPTGITDLLPVQKSWFPIPRRISLSLDPNVVLTALSIDFEVEAAFGQDTAFLFSFAWTPNLKELSASLWPGPPSTSLLTPPLTATMMPNYEDYQVFTPSDKSAQTTINLTDLLDSSASLGVSIPNGVLPTVTGLSLDLTLETLPGGGSQNTIEFYATMHTGDSIPSSVPPISIDALGVHLKYFFGSSDLSLLFDFSIALNSRSSAGYDPVAFAGSVYYYNHGIAGNGTPCWQLEASVNGLMVGHLFSFFEPQSQNGVMDLIEHIEMQDMSIKYDYDPSGAGNYFEIGGTLLFGDMQLTLDFTHSPNDQWEFTANLVAADATATINSVLGYISDEIQLPDFIGNINLLSDNPTLRLAVGKMDLTIGGSAVRYTFLQIDLSIGDFDVLFLQYTTTGWAGPKRIFRASLTGLSDDIPDIPVVGRLPQPYDELFFLYVQDSSGQPQSGILRQELNILLGDPNGPPITPPFMWKDNVRPALAKGTDTIYAVGLHFDVVAIENDLPVVVLDHLFSEEATTSQSKRVLLDDAPADSGSGSDSSMGAMKKTFGPLTISNIGIQFKNGHLFVLLDASFALGPIELDLLGFGLDFDLSKPGVSLKNPPIPLPTINGLGFGFNQPPLAMDGLFERAQSSDGSDLFLGGVVVEFEPYLFMAAGCYGIMKSGTDLYKTVALYALLEGPLVELEFAEIDGICGGFGYNSNVKFPTIDTVTSFPFIAQTGIGSTPLDTINNLLNPTTGCLNAQDGSIWLAAGLNVDAFKLLNVDAVVVVEFSAADVKLGIFADVKGAFPPDPESFKIIYAELGLMATVDFGGGTMLIQGQLAPTSYVLDPACHLSGGFALGYWFGNNQHAGDWVFTIGGYHPQFQAPSYYPSVPRLAITWSIDSSLSISGQAYFALTPNACMGGGQLKASLSLDPLYAYFEAFADFLIKFQPFYFMGEAGIDVGVQFTLDLWIVTIHISVDITADLHIQGPPVHGYVHVDFWVFGFDIYFGDQQPADTAVDLLGFWALLKQQSQASTLLAGPKAANMLVPTGSLTDPPDPINPTPGDDVRDKAQQISCVGGQVTSTSQTQQTTESESWNVRAGPFAFSVASPFVIGHVDIEQGASADGSGQPIYSRPMELPGTLTSTMTIKVTQTEEGATTTVAGFRIQTPTFSRVPAAMWAQYILGEDPLTTGNYNNPMTSNTDLASTTILHMTSVTAYAPKPYYPNATTEPITKFNAIDASSEDVYPNPLTVPPTDATSTNWEPVIPTPSTEWTDVPKLWQTPDWGVAAQTSTVDVWTKAMGAAWKNALGASGALVSKAPGNLVEGFDAYVMAAPLITAVA